MKCAKLRLVVRALASFLLFDAYTVGLWLTSVFGGPIEYIESIEVPLTPRVGEPSRFSIRAEADLVAASGSTLMLHILEGPALCCPARGAVFTMSSRMLLSQEGRQAHLETAHIFFVSTCRWQFSWKFKWF